MYYIGVDPGSSGGIAILSKSGAVISAFATPKENGKLLELLANRLSWYGNSEGRGVAVLERVWSSPQMGVASAFTFGAGYGRVGMALSAVKVDYTEVVPRKWQAALGVVYPPKSKQTVKKNISKARAIALFPHEPVTHAIADALLLAEYCRRIHVGSRSLDRQDQSNGEKGSTEKGKVESRRRKSSSSAQAGAALSTSSGHGAGNRRNPQRAR